MGPLRPNTRSIKSRTSIARLAVLTLHRSDPVHIFGISKRLSAGQKLSSAQAIEDRGKGKSKKNRHGGRRCGIGTIFAGGSRRARLAEQLNIYALSAKQKVELCNSRKVKRALDFRASRGFGRVAGFAFRKSRTRLQNL